MSTHFSLRRLSKMVKAIDALINEARDDINRSTSVTINVQDEMTSIKSQVNCADTEFDNAADRFRELLSLRTTLRLAVGKANQANGVNDLVTELQMVNTCLALYTHLKQRHGHEEKLTDANLELRVEAAKTAPAPERGYGYGGRDDTLTVTTISDDVVEWVQESLSEAKFRSEAIIEQLERINTSIMLKMTEEVVLTLVGFGVIQDPIPAPALDNKKASE